MKTRNRILALLMALCMGVSLTACGSSEGEAPAADSAADSTQSAESPEAPAASEESAAADLPSDVTLTFWTDQSIDPDAWQAEFARFAEEYKDYNYSLEIEAFAGSDRATKVAAAVESNSLPDLCLFAWFTSSDWCHEGHLLDISDVVEPVSSKLYPAVYEETKLGGKSYMLPLWSNYWSLIYNADMLKDAGLEKYVNEDPYDISIWTMSEFEEILAGVSGNMSGDQYCLPVFTADNQADTTNILWLSSQGGKLWGDDGLSNAGNDEKVIAALDKLKEWADKGYTNSNIISKSNNEVPSQFCNGLCCFTNGYYSNYTDYKNQMEAGDIDTFDIRLAAFPTVNADGSDDYRFANYVYGLSMFDTGNADQIAVAKLFMKWLSEDKEALTNLCMAVSSYTEIAEDADVIAANPMFTSYNTVVDADHIMNFHGNVAGYVSTRSILFPELQAFFGGQKDSKQAMTDYMNAANESIQEYIDNSVILN